MRAESSTGQRLQRPALVWEVPGRDPAVFAVRPGQPITIGRDATNTIVFDSAYVSKTHAVVNWRGGECTVEDLGSANGTTVNGLPVQVSELRAGDVIEVGDHSLMVRDLAPPKDGVKAPPLAVVPSSTKTLRLALTAVGSLVVMTLLLTTLAPKRSTPVSAGPPPSREVVVPARPASAPAVGTTPEIAALIQQALNRAATAGIQPAAALFDDAQMLQMSGRLFAAQALYDAARKQTPPHALAAARYEQVSSALERAIAIHQAEAQRARAQLRHDEAIAALEQVMMLTDPADPRHREAEEQLTRAKATRASQ